MRALNLTAGRLAVEECRAPAPRAGEVLIRVAYAGVNRADLMQVQGKYPLPEGNPAIPGMEVSGVITQTGAGVTGLATGDRVCALLTEGAFAEYAIAPASLVFPVPEQLSLEAAAALPEACFTVWISLVWQGAVKAGETVLIHGGASGIGTMAIQVAKTLGARVFATAGSEEKALLCERLGAERAIRYRSEDFVRVTRQLTRGQGVDVILDMVGGDYFARNLEALARKGRLCIIAFLEGAKVNTSLGPVLLKHLSIMGSTLRSRPMDEKEALAAELRARLWPLVAAGKIAPVLDGVFPLNEAEKALQRMEQGLNLGKILLRI